MGLSRFFVTTQPYQFFYLTAFYIFLPFLPMVNIFLIRPMAYSWHANWSIKLPALLSTGLSLPLVILPVDCYNPFLMWIDIMVKNAC